jgi:hypothetical protein
MLNRFYHFDDKYMMKFNLLLALIFLILSFHLQAHCLEDEKGKTCLIGQQNYPEKVFIFIPKTLDRTQNADLLFFFHGFIFAENNNYNKDVLERFQFQNKILQTQRNLVMIMPMSKGRCQDYKTYFTDELNIQKFIFEIQEFLTQEKIKFNQEYILASHSGGYTPLIKFLTSLPKKQVKEVYLFDSNYSQESSEIIGQKMAEFREDQKKFQSVFLEQGSTQQKNYESWLVYTQQESKNLANFLKAAFQPNQQMPKTGFIKSQKNHYELVNENFTFLLKE